MSQGGRKVTASPRHSIDSRAGSQGRQGVGCQNGEERGPEASGWEHLSTLLRIGALQDTDFPCLFGFATSIKYRHNTHTFKG